MAAIASVRNGVVRAVTRPMPECRASSLQRNPGSFRDPAGHVFEQGDRVFRAIGPRGRDDFEWSVASGVLADLVADRRVVQWWDADASRIDGAARVIEVERIPAISYPYEWPFEALQRAALFHLDLHLDLLARGGTLSDASAYNVQFLGTRPVFIDLPSIRRYRDGELWSGHRQFCEQFLNPLLLSARVGIAHHAWYRGALEGIPGQHLLPLLRTRDRFHWIVLTHVVVPERLRRRALEGGSVDRPQAAARPLPKPALEGLLRGLRRFVDRLVPAYRETSLWADYADRNSYQDDAAMRKLTAVQAFVADIRPRRLLDLGCNTGAYAEAALGAGASSVLGVESDPAAANLAFAHAERRGLDFLPLVVDAANPSPSQGWRSEERSDFTRRIRCDAVIALAFEHHLAIGRNIPLEEVVAWVVGLAPRGLIEFVPKHDPTVQRMLAFRQDIFPDYDESAFAAALRRVARIESRANLSATGRCLYRFDRS